LDRVRQTSPLRRCRWITQKRYGIRRHTCSHSLRVAPEWPGQTLWPSRACTVHILVSNSSCPATSSRRLLGSFLCRTCSMHRNTILAQWLLQKRLPTPPCWSVPGPTVLRVSLSLRYRQCRHEALTSWVRGFHEEVESQRSQSISEAAQCTATQSALGLARRQSGYHEKPTEAARLSQVQVTAERWHGA